jgi:hypothetical protein
MLERIKIYQQEGVIKMAKHCDFCMAKIEKDSRAVVIHQDYINPGFTDPTPRPALNPKTELCAKCYKITSDAIREVMVFVFEKLNKGTQEVIERLR